MYISFPCCILPLYILSSQFRVHFSMLILPIFTLLRVMTPSYIPSSVCVLSFVYTPPYIHSTVCIFYHIYNSRCVNSIVCTFYRVYTSPCILPSVCTLLYMYFPLCAFSFLLTFFYEYSLLRVFSSVCTLLHILRMLWGIIRMFRIQIKYQFTIDIYAEIMLISLVGGTVRTLVLGWPNLDDISALFSGTLSAALR